MCNKFTFLICSERSGSNFITKLMNAHSKICGPSVKHIINPVTRNLFRYGDLKNPCNWKTLLTDIHNLISVDFSVWKSQFTFETLEHLAQPGDTSKLISEIFFHEAIANKKDHVFIKENQLYEFLPFLLIHFPSAKFVYLHRDPRDMALSWKKNPDHKGGIIAAAKQWKKDQQQSLKSHSLLESNNQCIRLSYEKLTSDSQTEITKVLNFIGFDFEIQILDFYKDTLTQSNASKVIAWNNLSKGVISNNSNKFKKELSAKEISYIEKICYFEMMQLGYTPINSKPKLDEIPEDLLHNFESFENYGIAYKPANGVIGNMKAKAKFYQRYSL